jgi:hypothetical protein
MGCKVGRGNQKRKNLGKKSHLTVSYIDFLDKEGYALGEYIIDKRCISFVPPVFKWWDGIDETYEFSFNLP